MFDIGRRVAFLGTCLISGVFGICLGALSSYPSILVFVAFIGLGVGGNLPVDSTSECPQYDIFSSLIMPLQSCRGILTRGSHISFNLFKS